MDRAPSRVQSQRLPKLPRTKLRCFPRSPIRVTRKRPVVCTALPLRMSISQKALPRTQEIGIRQRRTHQRCAGSERRWCPKRKDGCRRAFLSWSEAPRLGFTQRNKRVRSFNGRLPFKVCHHSSPSKPNDQPAHVAHFTAADYIAASKCRNGAKLPIACIAPDLVGFTANTVCFELRPGSYSTSVNGPNSSLSFSVLVFPASAMTS